MQPNHRALRKVRRPPLTSAPLLFACITLGTATAAAVAVNMWKLVVLVRALTFTTHSLPVLKQSFS